MSHARLASHDLAERVARADDAVRARGVLAPRIGITLGSGLGAVAQTLEDAIAIPTADIPGWPVSTVAGHAGRLVVGRWRGVPVAVIAGRSHRYEGYTLDRATFGLLVLHALGADTLLFTNAAGGVGPQLDPGDLMLATDHVNFVGKRGLFTPDELRERRCGRRVARYHDPDLRAALTRAATQAKVPLRFGVLLGMHGPSYETAAEIQWALAMGTGAVCMSTVHEVTVAAHLGCRAASLSTITNRATGLGAGPLSHEEVTAAALAASARLRSVLETFLDGERASSA